MINKASYKEELLILGYHKLSVEQRIRNINHFRRITQKEICQVNPSDIEKYVKHYQNKGLISHTIQGYYRSLEHYFSYLEREQLIKKNPFNYYELQLPKVKKTQREILTQQEIKQLYTKANLQETIILNLCYGCGLRAFEMEQITLKDIDTVQKTVTVQKGKNNKYRVIPLSEKINQDLINYLETIKHNTMKHQNILYNKAGTPLKRYTALMILKKLAIKANIKAKITLHGLRHSIATHLLENGVQLPQVQAFLGHSQMETTEIYTRISNYQLKKL
ncbi:tyrosine-type recombinase/integrase [Flavobacterium oreochromis]|uniref:tyrosine-type recombinase/integrase n=1 Tax=Flavobacterium oreochromis TaxID=2906078 RepID=UPI001CE51B98|nr:tyrosine-type recombinase/integrase [Flavobacterium oreochromis]QYS87190.1 tyrosine-type recombinase/integrase [Flavobacterium oreochromis]